MRRMTLTLVLLLVVTGCPGASMACPDITSAPAERQVLTGRALWSPRVIAVQAGGDARLSRCGFPRHGYVRGPPDIALDLTRMTRYDRLHMRANAGCDTVLLLRDPAGQWFFDDDSGTGQTASLSLPDPVDGRYLVWVGTYGPRGCAARLTLETF